MYASSLHSNANLESSLASTATTTDRLPSSAEEKLLRLVMPPAFSAPSEDEPETVRVLDSAVFNFFCHR